MLPLHGKPSCGFKCNHTTLPCWQASNWRYGLNSPQSPFRPPPTLSRLTPSLQVFIPRRTLDLKRSVEQVTAQLRSRGLQDQGDHSRGNPSVADIASHLGITEAAVQSVQLVKASTHVVGLEPGGSESNPYEDVQLAKVSRVT